MSYWNIDLKRFVQAGVGEGRHPFGERLQRLQQATHDVDQRSGRGRQRQFALGSTYKIPTSFQQAALCAAVRRVRLLALTLHHKKTTARAPGRATDATSPDRRPLPRAAFFYEKPWRKPTQVGAADVVGGRFSGDGCCLNLARCRGIADKVGSHNDLPSPQRPSTSSDCRDMTPEARRQDEASHAHQHHHDATPTRPARNARRTRGTR